MHTGALVHERLPERAQPFLPLGHGGGAVSQPSERILKRPWRRRSDAVRFERRRSVSTTATHRVRRRDEPTSRCTALGAHHDMRRCGFDPSRVGFGAVLRELLLLPSNERHPRRCWV